MRIWFLCLLIGWCALSVRAQEVSSDPVMTINGKAVSLAEFKRAYEEERKREENLSLQVFADRWIWRYLRMEEARKMGLDTTQVFYAYRENERKRMLRSFFLDSLQLQGRSTGTVNSPASRWVLLVRLFRYLPQKASGRQVEEAGRQLDSLYQVLQQPGTDFMELVARFSDDKQQRWMQALEMTEEEEKIAFSLRKGEVSLPFGTPNGICILKLIDEKVETDSLAQDRKYGLSVGRGADWAVMLDSLQQRLGYVPYEPGIRELLQQGRTDKMLFSIGEQAYTGCQFEWFAKAYPLSVKQAWERFVWKSLLDYADGYWNRQQATADRLRQVEEDYLVQEVERREVDVPSQQDRIGLAAYFDVHRSDYQWKNPRFRGLIFHCKDKKMAKQLKKVWKKRPQSERNRALAELTSRFPATMVQVEKGDFERGKHPLVDRKFFHGPACSPSASHPFVVFVGEKRKGPEDYREVLKEVQKDYRLFLWTVWKRKLLASAQVEMNNLVLKSVNNN